MSVLRMLSIRGIVGGMKDLSEGGEEFEFVGDVEECGEAGEMLEGVEGVLMRWKSVDIVADHFRELTERVLANMTPGVSILEDPALRELQEFKEAVGFVGMSNIANVLLMRLKRAEERIKELKS
jgi:hypothetical protein